MTTRERSTPSLSKISCCLRPTWLAACVCVEIGTPVARWAFADARRIHPRLVGRALDDSCSDAGVHDPILDVLDEQLSDVIDAPAGGRAEMVWYLPVNSGGHDDLHSAARDHVLHKRNVPPVAGCQVHEGIDATLHDVFELRR